MSTEVSVDREMCIGSGNCVHLASGAIELDENGVAVVSAPQNASLEQLQRAARSCPTSAITVSES